MKRLLTSCFGLGLLPIAPGTWGSLPPVALFFALSLAGIHRNISIIIFAALAIIFSGVCLQWAYLIIKNTGKEDPSEVVADEVAGQSITMIFACFLTGSNNIYALCIAAFLLFRFFDITKIWPACKFEEFPSGLGVLADDLMAGIYAGLSMLLIFVPDWQQILSPQDGQSLSIVSAAILGIVQGFTEFLPVSSSGHLVLFENLLPGINADSPQMLMFDLSIHVATVGAIFAVYFKSFKLVIKDLFVFRKYGNTPIEIYKKSPSVHLLTLAIVTTVVTGAGYYLFKEPLESARKLPIVAVMWLITATLLLITDGRKKARMGLREFGIISAIIIGAAQTVAILPGISRSGTTICVAILIGLHRRWAVEYSFLIAIPAILGGTLLKIIEDYSVIQNSDIQISTVLTAMAAAMITGIVALKFLIKTSRKRKLKWFAIYCYALSAASMIYWLFSR